MAEFIRKRQRVHVEEYRLVYPTGPGTAYSFPCDKDGILLTPQMSDIALLNFQQCLERNLPEHVEDRSHDYWEDAIIKCIRCGGEIALHGFTNTCPTCEKRGVTTDYNMSGQLLAPRSQWGEETNETPDEIMMGGEDY